MFSISLPWDRPYDSQYKIDLVATMNVLEHSEIWEELLFP